MTTTPEPSKGVPRIEGDPSPTIRADHNDLADWVRDHTGESYPTEAALPSDGNFPGRTAYVANRDRVYVWKSASLGWAPAVKITANAGFNDTTNGNGILLVRHNLGAVPNWCQVTMRNSGVDAVSAIADGIIWDNPPSDPNAVQIRFRNSSNGSWLGNNKVAGYLAVGV